MRKEDLIDKRQIECSSCGIEGTIFFDKNFLFTLPPGWSLYYCGIFARTSVLCSACIVKMINETPQEDTHEKL